MILERSNVMHDRLNNAFTRAAKWAAGGAILGGAVVSGVCAVGGSVFGPVGTFFGLAVGEGTGAAVGAALASLTGFVSGLLDDGEKVK